MPTTVAQMRRFVRAMADGDRVVTGDNDARTYCLGVVAGPATYRPDAIAELPAGVSDAPTTARSRVYWTAPRSHQGPIARRRGGNGRRGPGILEA